MRQRWPGRRIAWAPVALLLLSGPRADAVGAPDRIALRLTPAVAWAPAALTVRATIESNSENRELEVIAESDAFVRSSSISLDGAKAPKLNVFEFRSLPSGTYTVTGVLVDSSGRRLTATRMFQVVPSPGAR